MKISIGFIIYIIISYIIGNIIADIVLGDDISPLTYFKPNMYNITQLVFTIIMGYYMYNE
jgi:drug/metabolite transporter (DMT)-like permease